MKAWTLHYDIFARIELFDCERVEIKKASAMGYTLGNNNALYSPSTKSVRTWPLHATT
jgi:hypothetical protein